MTHITLGSTGIVIEKNGFGCLPIQRISREEAAHLLRKAVDGGINFFDTARAYTDSEEKMGYAFRGMRDKVVIASKSGALTGEEMKKDLETSLRDLGTDYIDLYQFHNPPFCPKPGGEDGLYDAALEAKRQGKIRHIGITNHRLPVAHEVIDSGLYETLQFPYSYLSGPKDQELVDKCREKNMGFIAMKGLSGGLLRNGLAAAAWMARQMERAVRSAPFLLRRLAVFFISSIPSPPFAENSWAEHISPLPAASGSPCRGPPAFFPLARRGQKAPTPPGSVF